MEFSLIPHTISRSVRPYVFVTLAIALTMCLCHAASAMEFPGVAPGPAEMCREGQTVVLSNALLEASWAVDDQSLQMPTIKALQMAEELQSGPNEPFIIIFADGRTLSTNQFQRKGELEMTRLEPNADSIQAAPRFGGWQATIRLVSPDRQIKVEWRLVFRDQSNYLQQELIINSARTEHIHKLLLDGIRLPNPKVIGSTDGSPVVAKNLFFACEHPMAKHRVEDDSVAVSLNRYRPVEPGRPWVVRWTTGVAPKGQMRRAFLYYVERERARPYNPFCYYISWFDIAGHNVTMNEQQCLEVIEAFGQEMVAKRHVNLDAFVFDEGWADTASLWQFHSGFPHGFAPLQKAAAKYGASLGTWISPFGGYGERKQERLEFGRAQGYETNDEGFSLAGPKYYRCFAKTCAEMVHKYDVRYLKFDGIGDPSELNGSSRHGLDMEALLQLIDDLRQVRPDLFFNTTAGTWPSPFWLWHSDSVFRGRDDVGWRGVGSNRQRWMTYRDMVGYQIRTERAPLYPFNSLKFQSVICAKLDGTIAQGGRRGTRLDNAPPLERNSQDLIDDIHMAAGSGTQLQEFFITSSMITPEVWDAMAEAIAWMRCNADVLVDSHGIGGDPSRGEPYGYASWSPWMGILALRNPSDKSVPFIVDLQDAFELPEGTLKCYELSKPWAKTSQSPRLIIQAGMPHTFRLAPFEVLVFEANPTDKP